MAELLDRKPWRCRNPECGAVLAWVNGGEPTWEMQNLVSWLDTGPTYVVICRACRSERTWQKCGE